MRSGRWSVTVTSADPNPRDGRSYLVVLTGDGLRAHADAHARFERVGYQAFVAELPDGEPAAQSEVAKLLEAAARAIHATVVEGSAPRVTVSPRGSRSR